MDSVYSPLSPYMGQIPGGLYAGRIIVVYGKVPHGADKFTINLMTAPYEGSDIALHIDFRYSQGCVVRNTLAHGQWQSEERTGGMPLQHGQYFEIMIKVEPVNFMIAINGVHFASYSHRMAIQNVTTLEVKGSVTISRIHYASQGGFAPPPFPTPFPTPYPNSSFQPYGGRVVYKPSTPFISPIPGGFRVGSRVTVIGKSSTFSSRFAVNLQCGGGDIALHFNPRFNEKAVVRNSMMGGNWGIEERHTSQFPFRHNQRFVIEIVCHSAHYEILVNGHTYTFNHRIYPIERVDTINIDGEIKLKEVIF